MRHIITAALLFTSASALAADRYIGQLSANPYAPNKIQPGTPLSGAKLVDQNGTYRGTLGSKYEADSVNNPYGRYGSQYSSDSINNPYSSAGSKYSADSPNNPYGNGVGAYTDDE